MRRRKKRFIRQRIRVANVGPHQMAIGGRYRGYRDYIRRVEHIHHLMTRGQYRLSIFDNYNVHNLHKMRNCLDTTHLARFSFDAARLRQIRIGIIKAINNRYRKCDPCVTRSLLISRFVSSKIDRLKIESVLQSSVGSLPAHIRGTFKSPMVAWYYPQTLGQKCSIINVS